MKSQARLFARAGVFGFLELVDDLQDAVSADHRVIDDELECGSVFEDNRSPDHALDAFAVANQEIQTALLLFSIAQDADEDDSRVEIPGNIDVVYGHQPHLAHRELATDHFADLSLQEFAHTLESK
jgi:hypothetical protein